MEHISECLERTKRYLDNRVAYEKAWPRYCKTCGGSGYTGGSIDFDTGMRDSDPCPDCTEFGKCPRCGELSLDEEATACGHCGWQLDVSYSIPEPPECLCGMEEEVSKYYDIRPVFVTCPKCHKEFDESTVEFVDIESNIYGEDVLTFVCPNCKETVSSLRRG